jgi:membrane-bound lytic murein transglycosylase MltF
LFFLLVYLIAGAILAPSAPAESTSSQNKAPVVAPPATTKQWTGDLDVLLKHRVIRVGVPYSKTLFYTVKGTPYGISYEMGREFEKYLNKKYPQQNKNLKIHVLFAVSPREKALASGGRAKGARPQRMDEQC